MKLSTLFSSFLIGAVSVMSFSSCATAATDFNDVGKVVSLLLQNAHFERKNKEFNSKLSEQVFDTYLKALDPSRMFFTQGDVDKLRKKYGSELDSYFLASETMTPAREIYKLFEKRAEERIAFAQSLLEKNNFTFDSDKTIERQRKDSKWPKDEAEAKVLWQNWVEEQVLSENLRRETIARLAKQQGKPDPSAEEKPPTERLKLRYGRILHSIKEVDDEDMANYLLSALANTYDPHTDYMSARELDRFKSSMKGSLIGIGALLGAEDDGSTKITGIVVGGPADKSNKLKLNDKIVAVDATNDGEMTDILYMKIDKVVDLIRGTEGSKVRLKVESPDTPGQAKIVTITRSQVELKDELAKGEIIEEKEHSGAPRKIGILSLPSFYFDMDGGERRCSTDVKKILQRMNKEQVNGLVIDLRGNGGGSLEEVRHMSGFFIGGGPVVQIKDTGNRIEIKSANPSPVLFTKPVVVLTDKTSASASEILAAVLQDYGRAVIVGDTSTFGKGTVQQPIDIGRQLPAVSDSERAGALKITTQKFYRVAGGSTQHKGVVSDIVIPSATAAFDDLGESKLDFPLPYDDISPAKNYTKDKTLSTLMSTLKERSTARVASDENFKLLNMEIDRTKEKMADNKLSLNKSVRQKEIDSQEAWRKNIVDIRKATYPKIVEQDEQKYNIYRMTLDDLKNDVLPKADWKKDKDSTMIMAKDGTEDLDESPDIPSGLDWGLREAVNIVDDIIDLSPKTESTTEK